MTDNDDNDRPAQQGGTLAGEIRFVSAAIADEGEFAPYFKHLELKLGAVQDGVLQVLDVSRYGLITQYKYRRRMFRLPALCARALGRWDFWLSSLLILSLSIWLSVLINAPIFASIAFSWVTFAALNVIGSISRGIRWGSYDSVYLQPNMAVLMIAGFLYLIFLGNTILAEPVVLSAIVGMAAHLSWRIMARSSRNSWTSRNRRVRPRTMLSDATLALVYFHFAAFSLVLYLWSGRTAWQRAPERVRNTFEYVVNTQLGEKSNSLFITVGDAGLRNLRDPSRIVLVDQLRRIRATLLQVDNGTVALVGARGVGKSTVLAHLIEQLSEISSRKQNIAFMVSAPAGYVPIEFLTNVLRSLCDSVLVALHGQKAPKIPAKNRLLGELTFKIALVRIARLLLLGVALLLCLLVALRIVRVDPLTSAALGQLPAAIWQFSSEEAAQVRAAIGAAAIWRTPVGALSVGLTVTIGFAALAMLLVALLLSTKRRRRVRALSRLSMTLLQQIDRTTSRTTERAIGGPAPVTSTVLKGARTEATVALNTPWLVDELAHFVNEITRYFAWEGKPASITIGIDELDRIGSPNEVSDFIREISGLFLVPGIRFVLTTTPAEDQPLSSSILGTPALEAAVDLVIRVNPLDFGESFLVLKNRLIGMTPRFAALAHVLAAGVPRELVRVVHSMAFAAEASSRYNKPDLASFTATVACDEIATAAFRLVTTIQEKSPELDVSQVAACYAALRSPGMGDGAYASYLRDVMQLTRDSLPSLRDEAKTLGQGRGDQVLKDAMRLEASIQFCDALLFLFGAGQERFWGTFSGKEVQVTQVLDALCTVRRVLPYDPGLALQELRRYEEILGFIREQPAPDQPAEVSTSVATDLPVREDVEKPEAAACDQCSEGSYVDGYCSNCGAKEPNPRDHYADAPAPWVAGVCDIGKRHRRNEDAMALAAQATSSSFAALVVCDGVSQTTDSHLASMAASHAALDVLCAPLLGAGDPDWSFMEAGKERLTDAVGAAIQAVQEVTQSAGHDAVQNPPCTTIVAALVLNGSAIVANVGDSRAYWLPDALSSPAKQLSQDDSMAGQLMSAGVPREEAESGGGAHSITRWLGIDAPPDVTPHTNGVELSENGWLVVCSDGLSTYCSDAADLRALVHKTINQLGDLGRHPPTLAQALIDFANGAGGIDNITVALARVGPLHPPVTSDTEEACDSVDDD